MDNFQENCRKWAVRTFGEERLTNFDESHFRFMEEAVELVQSSGMSKEEVLKVVDYVYDRPVGDLSQEIGGVMVCLAILCTVNDRSLKNAAFAEIDRCWHNVDKIRSKQAAKPKSIAR